MPDAGTDHPPTNAPTEASPSADWRTLLAAGKHREARNAYLVSGEEDPSVRAALTALHDTVELLRERSFDRAAERIGRLEEHPGIVDWGAVDAELATLKESAAALDQREPDRARELLLQVEDAIFPGEVLTQLGTTYIYDSDLGEAERLFRLAIDADARQYRALTNLGNVALEQGDVDEAISLYQRALAIDEEFPNAHHNLGVAYRRKGQLTKSVKSLRRAQRSQQRVEVSKARESMGKWAGPGITKNLKWVMWAVVIGGVYLVLRATGQIG